MKTIVLIGASGFVGSAILKEALSRGHRVTAVVRHPENINLRSEQLTIVKADVSSAEKVAIISNGCDAVISAYNPGWTHPDAYNETLKVYPAILEGAKKGRVKRLLCLGGAGSLFYAPGLRVYDSGVIPEGLLPAVKGLAEFYLHILTHENDIDWVFFSPAGKMSPGQRTGKFRLGKDDLIVDEKGESLISVEDYALAMIDELETGAHHRERFTIGY